MNFTCCIQSCRALASNFNPKTEPNTAAPVKLLFENRLIVIDVIYRDVNGHSGREGLGQADVFGLHEQGEVSVFLFVDVGAKGDQPSLRVNPEHIGPGSTGAEEQVVKDSAIGSLKATNRSSGY